MLVSGVGGGQVGGLGLSGPKVGCSYTYLGPGCVSRGDKGRVALLHQIGKIGVAGETIADGGAPPPSAVFLQREMGAARL